MDIAFIHGNFPGQFKYLASILGAQEGHNIVFLTNSESASDNAIRGVRVKRYAPLRSPSVETHQYLKSVEGAVLEGQAVVRALAGLAEEGFKPRLIIFHGGNGLGLFLRDYCINTKLVGYFEWYFQRKGLKFLVGNEELDTCFGAECRNMVILKELEACDRGIVPTAWQKEQFPEIAQTKLDVIFDGIDTAFFSYRKTQDKQAISIKDRDSGELTTIDDQSVVVTYATRGMEPLRGFPEFMRAARYMLEKDKNIQIVIAGADRCAYSYQAPNKSGSWKEFMLDELGEFQGKERLHFCGLLDYADYRSLLWRSDLHCYFSRDYVPSWSFFEAAACGCRMAVSSGETTKNVVEEGTCFWVDLDSTELGMRLLSCLREKKVRQTRLRPEYDLMTAIKKWEYLLQQVLG